MAAPPLSRSRRRPGTTLPRALRLVRAGGDAFLVGGSVLAACIVLSEPVGHCEAGRCFDNAQVQVDVGVGVESPRSPVVESSR